MTVRWMRFFRTFGILTLLVGAVAFGGMGLAGQASAQSSVEVSPPPMQTDGTVPGDAKGSSSVSNFWRGINKGSPGTVSIPNKQAAVLINRTGEDWRVFRSETMPLWGGALFGLTLLGILGLALVYGKFKLHAPRTGRVIVRFSQAERWIHWFVACLFVLLGLSGLVLLLGRTVLKPIIGAQGLGVIANASLQAHNLLGPLFIVGLAIMLVLYLKDNIYQKGDFTWLLKGGFFSKSHPPSWKYNLGEKFWYWLLAIAGTAVCVSGVFMIFPTLLSDLLGMQLSQVAHSIAAIALLVASAGHIYLGVWGVEGALDSMTRGYVDETWGLEHHRWWAEKEIDKDHVVEGAPDAILAARSPEET